MPADDGAARQPVGRRVGVVDEQVTAVPVDEGNHVRGGGDDAGIAAQVLFRAGHVLKVFHEGFVVLERALGVDHATRLATGDERGAVPAAAAGIETGDVAGFLEHVPQLFKTLRGGVELPAEMRHLPAHLLRRVEPEKPGQGGVGVEQRACGRDVADTRGAVLEGLAVAAFPHGQGVPFPAQPLLGPLELGRAFLHLALDARGLAVHDPRHAHPLRNVDEHAEHQPAAGIGVAQHLENQRAPAGLVVVAQERDAAHAPVARGFERGQDLGNGRGVGGEKALQKPLHRFQAGFPGTTEQPAQRRRGPDHARVRVQAENAEPGRGKAFRLEVFRIPRLHGLGKKKQRRGLHLERPVQGLDGRKRWRGRAPLDLVEVLQGHAGTLGQSGLGKVRQAAHLAQPAAESCREIVFIHGRGDVHRIRGCIKTRNEITCKGCQA